MRTNCVDNLDRTNVVQSLFARRSLLAQLNRKSDSVLTSNFPAFEKAFKNLWADNANALSMFYSGTNALKTDFTRTGKRTIFGAIADGWYSVSRYYLNNYCDGYRQDSYDVFLGIYKPNEVLSPYASQPYAFGPNSENRWLKALFAFLMSLLVILLFIVTLGGRCPLRLRFAVNKPLLVEFAKPAVMPTEVLSPDGMAAVRAASDKKTR